MWVKPTAGAVRLAVQDAAVCLLAYLGGLYVNLLIEGAPSQIGALWCVISGIVVLQATRRDTVALAWLRVLGTLIGATISTIYLLLLPFNPIGLAVTIGITMLVCYVFQIPDHARLAAITVAVIMVVSLVHPQINPLMNAGLRFIESCIGTALAVLAVLAWPGSANSR
jgi:uncharacterized membrane protein YgaE (UPF0421/DUF939 family)